MENGIKVIIADDHPMVRIGIRNLLLPAKDIEVIGEAADGEQALELSDSLNPDVLLLDMELPVMSGAEVVKRLHDRGSSVRVLGLSGHDDWQYVQTMLENGAFGYLLKDEAMDIILDAVRGAARGERGWLSRRIAGRVWDQYDDQKDLDKYNLSRREIEVLHQVIDGKTNDEIAYQFHISKKTVEKHMNNIFIKMGVYSRVEAAVMAVKLGLVGEAQRE